MSRTERRRTGGRFWLRPKWVVGHVLALGLVVTFVNLGLWQLDRLDERQERNAEIVERSELPEAPVAELVSPGAQLGDVDDLVFRRATATGTYDVDGQVLVRPRSLDGVSGWHVLTPLVLDGGDAVLVNRGFAPLAADPQTAIDATAPPEGEVTVSGLVLGTQERDGIGPTDPAEGTLLEVARVDIARIDRQYDGDLLPVQLQLVTQDPPVEERGLPQVLPPPATDDGPHLSYAGQWFLFALVGAVGWPLLLRRTARDEGGDQVVDAAPPPGWDDDGPDDGGDGGGGGGLRPDDPDPVLPREPVGAGSR